VLDADPLAVPADRLRELKVLATIKEGRLVAGQL
jgi:predicted amidohydrolase YtcJ